MAAKRIRVFKVVFAYDDSIFVCLPFSEEIDEKLSTAQAVRMIQQPVLVRAVKQSRDVKRDYDYGPLTAINWDNVRRVEMFDEDTTLGVKE